MEKKVIATSNVCQLGVCAGDEFDSMEEARNMTWDYFAQGFSDPMEGDEADPGVQEFHCVEFEKFFASCNFQEAEEGETYLGYVKIGSQYFVQKPDSSKYGFTIYDDDQSWEGGFGIANNKAIVPVSADRVPESEKARLAWILED